MDTQRRTRTQQRILSSVSDEPDTGCWIWMRQISNSGYGRITISGRYGNHLESAHRASYLAFIGPIPEPAIIRQSCGNRLCVNPDHLEVTTKQQ